jgi:hypothetical protein
MGVLGLLSYVALIVMGRRANEENGGDGLTSIAWPSRTEPTEEAGASAAH